MIFRKGTSKAGTLDEVIEIQDCNMVVDMSEEKKTDKKVGV